MKFNPNSWLDSSSPKGSKFITKTKVCLCRTIPSLFLYNFHKYRRFGEKEITHLATGIVFCFVLFFWWGGGGGEW